MNDFGDAYYQAVLARDARFDGKFFIGVKTTGIYCRPICPARPKRQNVEFFVDALAAERAGYRPCLRCRPESAPLSPVWMGRSATIRRALKLIYQSGLADTNEDQFAAQLGVSARHLRRLFELEVGKSPKQIADAHRLAFARKLVLETRLPMTEIAYSSGFQSIRRFNAAFKARFTRSPSEQRDRGGRADEERLLQLNLAYRPPYDWPAILRFFRTHQIPGVEEVNDQSYSRVFKINGVEGALKVQKIEDLAELQLSLSVRDARPLFQVVQSVRQMFDLDSDWGLVARAFADGGVMGRLAEKYPGLRLGGGWHPFETSICAILGQLVSVEQAQRLVGQLVSEYGEPTVNPITGKAAYLFPTPQVLANAKLTALGTTQGRKNAIRGFAQAIASCKLSLDPTQDAAKLRDSLLSIPGIGPWTAEYICLRALGDADAFPATDLILKRALELHPEIDLDRFRPWRGYAAVYLWQEYAQSLSHPRKPKKNEKI